MDLDCLSEKMSISGLSDLEKLVNACTKRNNNIYKTHKYYPTSGSCASLKLIYFARNNQDPLKLLRILELKVHLISWHLYKKYKTTVKLWIITTVIFVRFDQIMAQSLHKRIDFKSINIYPKIFLLKFATMNGQT